MDINLGTSIVTMDFDYSGNIYFHLNKNGTYDFNIDRNNILTVEPYENGDVILEIDDPIIEKIADNVDELNDCVDEFEEENEDVKFIVCDDSILKDRLVCRDTEIPLYDVQVYNNTKLLLKTELIGVIPIYRIVVYTNGLIYFKETGGKDNKYKFTIVEDILGIVYC